MAPPYIKTENSKVTGKSGEIKVFFSAKNILGAWCNFLVIYY